MNKTRLYLQLRSDEGVVREIYSDPRGFKSFGIGHLVKRGDPEWNLSVGTTITSKRMEEVFRDDVEIAINACETLYGEAFAEWPCEVQEIVANMMFNLGKSGLSKFKRFKKSLEAKDWKQAAEEGRQSLWYTQVTNRAERLMKRLEAVA